MGKALTKMSRTIPISSAGLAQITASGGQLGVAAKDLVGFTESVAKMSTAFDMTTAEAGDAMAKVSNVFQIPITDLTQLGDVINHLSNNTVAKAKEIIPALNRAGGSVKSFGLSAQQASALVGTVIGQGNSEEKAGTAVDAILRTLVTAEKLGQKGQQAFGAIGISVQDLKKAISEDAQGALMQFLEAMEKIKPQERTGILVDIFGKNFQGEVGKLVNNLGEYKKAVAMISDPKAYGGSMEKEFAARAATTANNLQLLKNSINEIAMDLGTTLLPAINKLVDGLRTIGSTVSDFAKAHPEVVTAITSTVGVLISCKVAAIALGYAWTFVKGGILSASVVIKGIQVAFATLKTKLLATGTVLPTVTAAFRALTAVVAANPIGAAITALAVGATLIIANWEKVKAFFTTIWDSIKPIWEKFSNFATGIFDKITSPLKAIKSGIGGLFGSSEEKKSPDKSVFESMNSGIGSLFSSSEEKKSPDIKKLPQISKANVSKNQNNSFNITVNATPDQNPTSIANSVSEKMKEFSGAFLYDPIGEVP
jgi:TP901 family phage tail tape measure protein